MAYSIEHISEQIFKLIKGFGFTIVLFTDNGKKTSNPQEARRFFARDIQMMVNFVANETTSEIVINLSSDTDIKKIKPLMNSLRTLANSNIIEYTVKSFGKSISPKDFAYQAKAIGESSMDTGHNKKAYAKGKAAKSKGTSKSSCPYESSQDNYKHWMDGYNGKQMVATVTEGFSGWRGTARKSVNELGDARLVVMHSRNVDETARGGRTRQIESIFIESGGGERFKFPSKSLSAAKAMVRHVKEGGTPYDEFGQYIYETLEELTQLRNFQRKNRRNDFFEDANIGGEIGGRVSKLRSTLTQISGPKGYAHHFESFKRDQNPIAPEKLDELKDNVTVKYFDESISGSLPYVARIIEAMRGRQEKEAEVIEFGRYVMGNRDSILLSKEIDPSDPENPEGRKFRDPATAFAAWVTFLTPHIQDDVLANHMMKVSDTVFEVDAKYLNMAAAAINVIRQKGKVSTGDVKQAKKKSVMADGVNHITESFEKFVNFRKLFS